MTKLHPLFFKCSQLEGIRLVLDICRDAADYMKFLQQAGCPCWLDSALGHLELLGTGC